MNGALLPPQRPTTDEPTAEQSAATLAALHKSLDSVVVARPAAVRVLAVVDDRNASAQTVAGAIEADPDFSVQIMRLANSAYYGMSGKIGNVGFAVAVIGFSAVRSLAALNATGLDQADRPKPDGFWRHAAASAAGCAAVATRYGIVVGDAFAAGLLHDLGTALLHGFDRDAHQRLLNEHGSDGKALADAEEARFGLGHPAAASRVLASWRFPEPFVEAIARHHDDPAATEPPFVDVIRAGDLLAELSLARGLRLDITPHDDSDDDVEPTDADQLSELEDVAPQTSDTPEVTAARARLVEMGFLELELDELIVTTSLRTSDILASLPT